MRYGILSFGNCLSNLGDVIQTIGVLHVYKNMGISKEELIQINNHNLTEYSGETVTLPMAGYFNAMHNIRTFPLSPKIVPAFLGFHCTDEKILRYLENDKFEPFGCRDLATLRMIKQTYGSNVCAFMSGCFSLCIEQRGVNTHAEKIFLVDVIEEFFPYIPINIRKTALCHSQISRRFSQMSEFTANDEAISLTMDWLEVLRQQARLVVTSRLHLALPCVAMGIPVIVARRYNDDTDRYSGYDQLFHVYMPDEYENVNWNPVVKDIEWIKTEIINNAITLLRVKTENESNPNFLKEYRNQTQKVSNWFEQSFGIQYYGGETMSYLSQKRKEEFFRNKDAYGNILSYILERPLNNLHLIIWGAGDKGKYMMRRYAYLVKQFVSCTYIDSDSQKWQSRLCGYEITSPDAISKFDKEKLIIIVAIDKYYSISARKIASQLCNHYGLVEGRHYFMLDKLDSSARMAIDEYALTATLM